MAWSVDARIPVIEIADPAALPAGTALLAEAGTDAPPDAERFQADAPHKPGCACCLGRSDLALALDRLFQARVRGTRPWFASVAVLAPSAAGRAALAAALAEDALTRARYRAA
jgi:hypothetical protein